MAEKKMSVHQALAEVKTYDDRIANATNPQNGFIIGNKKSNKTPNGMSIEELKGKMQGNLASVKALIENKKIIKSAVAMSNAVTKVNIGGIDYTVIEAIERKNLILLEERLLDMLKKQYQSVLSQVAQQNAVVDGKLNDYLKSNLGDIQKVDTDVVKKLTEQFYELQAFEVIDPNNLKDYIAELENRVYSFKTEVDYKLSEINSTTFITVNLKD